MPERAEPARNLAGGKAGPFGEQDAHVGFHFDLRFTPQTAIKTMPQCTANVADGSFTTDAFSTRADQCPLLLQERHYCSA